MTVEFDAGFFKRELPFYGDLRRIPLGHARGDLGREFGQSGDTLVQALVGDSRKFELDHVEPGGMFGRVVHLEAGSQRPCLGGGQVLVKDGSGVRVEVVLHEHDFLGLRVVGGQALHKAAVVSTGVNFPD